MSDRLNLYIACNHIDHVQQHQCHKAAYRCDDLIFRQSRHEQTHRNECSPQQEQRQEVGEHDAPCHFSEEAEDHAVQHHDGNADGVQGQCCKVLAKHDPRQGNRRRQQTLVGFLLQLLTEQPHGQNRDQEHDDHEQAGEQAGHIGGSTVQAACIEEVAGEQIEHCQKDICDTGGEERSDLTSVNCAHYLAPPSEVLASAGFA